MVNIDALAVRVGSETIVTRERDLGVVVRRVEFDHALARAAIARGIEVRDGCAVTAIAVDDDRVTVETATGDAYRARAIVGADGVAGIVRRTRGFPRGELRAQVVELDTECVAVDLPRDTLVFDFTARDLRGYAWDFPTFVAGEPLMCRGTYACSTARARRDRRARASSVTSPRAASTLARYRAQAVRRARLRARRRDLGAARAARRRGRRHRHRDRRGHRAGDRVRRARRPLPRARARARRLRLRELARLRRSPPPRLAAADSPRLLPRVLRRAPRRGRTR